MMYFEIIAVVLNRCAIKVPDAYLTQILVPLLYLFTLPLPDLSPSESILVIVLLLSLRFLTAVELAIVNPVAILAAFQHCHTPLAHC